jgi:hypothetical protein
VITQKRNSNAIPSKRGKSINDINFLTSYLLSADYSKNNLFNELQSSIASVPMQLQKYSKSALNASYLVLYSQIKLDLDKQYGDDYWSDNELCRHIIGYK